MSIFWLALGGYFLVGLLTLFAQKVYIEALLKADKNLPERYIGTDVEAAQGGLSVVWPFFILGLLVWLAHRKLSTMLADKLRAPKPQGDQPTNICHVCREKLNDGNYR